MTATLTNHAQKRMAQRGVQGETVENVIHFGDRKVFVGDGRVSISVSRNQCRKLAKMGMIKPAMADRLENLYVVVEKDDNTVITVLHPSNRKSARSYIKPNGYSPHYRGRRHH